ncbi:hypothetical protein [Candidatus Clostridium stratigraminis]|uniref:Uncharacterized protein n=1 Tax=Candidatus Clostridium stratigraminis TaxID=3381661 RepID=A0ABW8T075_9CLOT
MFFINSGKSIFIILALAILIFLIFINFLPYILLISGITWIISYVYKKFKNRSLSRDPNIEVKKGRFESSKKEDFKDFNKANIIDVDYTEVK